MPEIVVVDRAGHENTIKAAPDRTLMEVIRDSGFDDLLALCGGCCSCATCHVFIDPEFSERLPEMSGDEYDLLDTSDHRTTMSRLSCQIALTTDMSGMRVTIAPDD